MDFTTKNLLSNISISNYVEYMSEEYLSEYDSSFDIEMLYIECGRCNRPIVWPSGRVSDFLEQVGIDESTLDANHLILVDGCYYCQKEITDKITISVVRFFDFTPEEAFYLNQKPGNA